MTDHQRPTWNRSLSPDDLRYIDQACNRFEDACCQGSLPRIEDFLNEVVVDLRPALLQELLSLEMAYRQDQGKTLNIAEFQQRFAAYSEIVAQVLMKIDSHTIDQIPLPNDESEADFSTPTQWPPTAGETPPRQIGNYEILDKIAEGGMGIVFKARQFGLNRIVALKMIRPGAYDTQTLRRFQTEAEAVAKLHHANIVQIHEVGTHKNNPFYSMEYVAGGSLDDRLDGTPWPADMAAELIATLARAIHTAHERRIVHRDLKPANVLLVGSWQLPVGREEDGKDADAIGLTTDNRQLTTAKITDFGLAKQLDSTTDGLTKTEMVMGTPSYMAPEQASGKAKAVGAAADIYALGAILYELLTGRPPFKAAMPLETLAQVNKQEPVPPRRLNAVVPKNVETICLMCLQKEPARRYGSAAALADDLERYLRHEPIAARPVGSFEKTRLWCRRNPRLAAMGSAIAFLIVIVAVVSSVSAVLLADRLDDLNEQIRITKKLEMAERDKRAEALYEKAHGMRISGRMGRRFEGLKALKEATEIVHSLNLPIQNQKQRLLRYRNEAIACKALPDFKVVKTWNSLESTRGEYWVDFDPAMRQYVKKENDGTISLWRIKDNTQIGRLQKQGANVQFSRFSRNGGLLAVSYTGSKDIGFCVWDVDKKKPVFERPEQVCRVALDFSPDRSHFAMATFDGTVHIFDLAQKKQVCQFQAAGNPGCLRFSPDGNRIAIVTWGWQMQIWDWRSRRRLHEGSAPGSLYDVNWREDGKYIAAPCYDRNAYVWDSQSGKQVAVLKGHRNGVDGVAFHPNGRFLVTKSWDGTTRLWDFHSQQEVLRTNGSFWRFSADGRRLAFVNYPEIGIWEVNLAEECRYLNGHQNADGVISSACSPDSRLVVTCGDDGLCLWDRNTWKLLRRLDTGGRPYAKFHPTTRNLISSSPLGLFEWPIVRTGGPNSDSITIGPAKRLLPEVSSSERIAFSGDGRALAEVQNSQRTTILHSGKMQTITTPDGKGIGFVSLSRDGKWLATTAGNRSGVEIWDAVTGKPIKQLDTISRTFSAFSPDGKWLVTCDSNGAQFWHVGTWQRAHSYPDCRLACPTFSPNGKILAVGSIHALRDANAVHLVEAATGRLVAKLENTPAPTQIEESLCFTPDGRHLIVPHWADNVFCAWDLESIRKQLAGMKLDQGLPKFADKTPLGAVKPINWTIEPGDLFLHSALQIAERHLNARRWQQALMQTNKVMNMDKQIPKAWLLRGRAQLGLKKTKEGLSDLEHYLKLKKAKADDYDDLAWTLAVDKGHEAKVYHKAVNWADTAIRIGLLSGKANLYYQSKGLAQYRAGIYENCIASLQIAHAAFVLSDGKNEPWSGFGIAMAHARLDEMDKNGKRMESALKWFHKAVEARKEHYLHNKDLTVFYQEALRVLGSRLTSRAIEQYKKNNHQLAVKAFTEIVKAGYNDVKVYHYRGHALQELKQYEKALADFKIAAAKQAPSAHYQDEISLLRCFGPKSIRDANKALDAANQAVRLVPASANYKATLGIAYYRLGKTDKAIAILKGVSDKSLTPNRAPLKYLFLALCHRKKGNTEMAAKALQRALSLYDDLKSPSVMLSDFFESTRREFELSKPKE